MDDESSFETPSDLVSTNISEAEKTVRWFQKLRYPNLCALSSIRFTHPELSISELDEYVVKDDELGPALMPGTIRWNLTHHLERKYGQKAQRERE